MTTARTVRVGSRTSPLALAQTEEVLSRLRTRFPAYDFPVVPITTGGDRNKEVPLLELGRGTFVKEIELALISGEIDCAVHSAKDLPSALPHGLILAAIGRRLDARDVLVDRWELPLMGLPPGARLGTGSPRRKAQLMALRPDVDVRDIRGNVGTRLDKARGDDYDGVILAAAGLVRLGRQDEVSEYMSPEAFTPEVGQGTLAVEARAGDDETIETLAAIDHRPSRVVLEAERAFLAELGGGCKVPITAHARVDGRTLLISAMAALPDGSKIYREHGSYGVDNPEDAGRRIAEALLRSAAAEIIEGT